MFGVAREQRVFADGVDQPRNSPRVEKHSLDRRPGKNLAGGRRPRNPKTAAYVLPGFVRTERCEMTAQRELLLAVKTLLEVRERMQESGTKGRLQ